ncbi:MAG: patatin-like phospholipase family protein, partial [bacterium]
LRELLERLVRFRHIDEALISGELEALALTAMSYNTGQSVTFYQGSRKIQPWTRSRRISKRTGLTIDHLMASSALPTLFPATEIDGHYYGDGALRLLKPLSPALHLGAERIFVIGVSDNPHQIPVPAEFESPPTISQVIGHMLNGVFIDAIESDLETLRMINRLASCLSEEERQSRGLGDLKPIDFITINPSVPINEIAQKYIGELPRSVRIFLKISGAAKTGNSSTASYLLFEKGFCRELLELGYKDGMAERKAIERFFGLETVKEVSELPPIEDFSVTPPQVVSEELTPEAINRGN